MAAVAPPNSNANLNFISCPPIYVLKSQISPQILRDMEDTLLSCNAPLTYDIREAGLVLTSVSTPKRARLELRWVGIDLIDGSSKLGQFQNRRRARKRPKIQRDSLSSSTDLELGPGEKTNVSQSPSEHASDSSDREDHVKLQNVSAHSPNKT